MRWPGASCGGPAGRGGGAPILTLINPGVPKKDQSFLSGALNQCFGIFDLSPPKVFKKHFWLISEGILSGMPQVWRGVAGDIWEAFCIEAVGGGLRWWGVGWGVLTSTPPWKGSKIAEKTSLRAGQEKVFYPPQSWMFGSFPNGKFVQESHELSKFGFVFKEE